jgi:hypothetical protein
MEGRGGAGPPGYVEVIASARRAAVGTLRETLAGSLDSNLSEAEIRDRWHAGLQTCPQLLREGWYAPPPHGIAVLVGSPDDGFARNGAPTLRPDPAWPSADRRMGRDTLLTAYASPVDERTGLIGDVMATLYWGEEASLHEHIRSAWQVTQAIAGEARVGMPYRDLYRVAIEIMEQSGMRNAIVGINDPTGTNIGHTIPWSAEPPSRIEREILDSKDPEAIAALISANRVFINSAETTETPSTGAFTIEPRLHAAGRPAIAFHVVVAFEQGHRHVVNELEPLFELAGMSLGER